MEQPNKLLAYLPEDYHNVREFIEITNTSESEFTLLDQSIDRQFEDQFVMTSSAVGISRRERMMRIQTDPATESLDFRRKRIINRLSTKPPFSERYLQSRLDYLFGPKKAVVYVDIQKFILRNYVSLPEESIFNEAQRTINMIKPANMEYVAVPWTREVIEIQDSITINMKRYHTACEFMTGMTPLKYKSEVKL